MGSRKLVRDFLLSKQFSILQIQSKQSPNARLRLLSATGASSCRRFSVFNEFSKEMKGEVRSNQEFQKSIKELKDKAGELIGVKEDLKVRTKQTSEQIYKHVDGAWTEAEAAARKVSASVKEKLSAATEEVKESLGLGKQEHSGSSKASSNGTNDAKDGEGHRTESKKETPKDSESPGVDESIFGRFKSTVSSVSPNVSSAFKKLRDTKVVDMAKKGFEIVKDELSSNPGKKKQMLHKASSSSPIKTSTLKHIVIQPNNQSYWSKKWEAFKAKVQGNPAVKRLTGISEPVVAKSQELAEDMREAWETSDHPVVHKIQDINESVFGESSAALSFKEIRRRDPSFSLPDFVAEVEDMLKPTLIAYLKGDVKALKTFCGPRVIERCEAERRLHQSQGNFFDQKILHISELEVRETKIVGTSPVIIVAFQTQQIHCVRDNHGAIKDGGEDTIHTVYYAWAMEQLDAEEIGEGAYFPAWRLQEMQQIGVKALI